MYKLIIPLLLFVLSCSNVPMNNEQKPNIESLFEGNLYGNGKEGFQNENLVINTEEDWGLFLKQLNKENNVSNEFDTSVDFTKKNVIIAIDRVRNSGGFSIKITEARFKNDKIEMVVKIEEPKPTDMVAAAIMQPIHIITTNKTNKSIVFVKE